MAHPTGNLYRYLCNEGDGMKRRIRFGRVTLLVLVVTAACLGMKQMFAPSGAGEAEIPDVLQKAAEKNPELKTFAQEYPNKKDQDLQGIPAEYQEGVVPQYLQWDERWGYTQYGDTYLGLSGCGPTVVSMAASYLLSDGTLTPNAVARFSEQNGYYVDGVGSSWSLIEEGLPQLGVRVQIGSLEEGAMAQVIERGGVILCSVGPGTFTDSGHFILLCGYAQGEGFLVHDPNSAVRSGRYYRFTDLADEIVQLWFAYR